MKLIEAAELAEILRVNRQRVYELARRNVIPVVRIGNREHRFDADAIQAMDRGWGIDKP